MAEVKIKAVSTPNQNQMAPASELAIIAAMLWNPANDPMAESEHRPGVVHGNG